MRKLLIYIDINDLFCHNRALQDLSPDSYGCCSQQDLSLRQPHRFRMNPTSSPFDERAWKDRNLLMLVEYQFAEVHQSFTIVQDRILFLRLSIEPITQLVSTGSKIIITQILTIVMSKLKNTLYALIIYIIRVGLYFGYVRDLLQI